MPTNRLIKQNIILKGCLSCVCLFYFLVTGYPVVLTVDVEIPPCPFSALASPVSGAFL